MVENSLQYGRKKGLFFWAMETSVVVVVTCCRDGCTRDRYTSTCLHGIHYHLRHTVSSHLWLLPSFFFFLFFFFFTQQLQFSFLSLPSSRRKTNNKKQQKKKQTMFYKRGRSLAFGFVCRRMNGWVGGPWLVPPPLVPPLSSYMT